MRPQRIALMTPWPKQQSGIADFAYDLAHGIAALGHQVDVFTNSADVSSATADVRVTRVTDAWDGRELRGYKHRLYELGNHDEFHAWMLEALARFPGVVQLHDIVLHHLLVGMTCARKHWPEYLKAVNDWYGATARIEAGLPLKGRRKPIWETAEVIDMPFFELFVENASAIIVHSRFAALRVARTLPRVPCVEIAQTYRVAPPVRSRQALKRIGIFGGVQSNKKLDWIIEAFGYLDTFLEGIDIVVVGKVEADTEALVAQAQRLRNAAIRFVGRATEEEFIAEMGKTDLCIALRHPTMGETSAVVMRALQMGIPTIVSDTGWYAELPDDVLKAPLDNTPHFLSSTIHRLVTRPSDYETWAQRCFAMIESMDLSHEQMCARVVHHLTTVAAGRWVMDSVAARTAQLGFTGDGEDARVLAALQSRTRI